jgi:septum formation protein
MTKLILASGSSYRRRLLERLRLPFEVAVPRVAELRLEGEAAPDMARRLAGEKARAIAAHYPGAVVIGSDQVAQLGASILGKPGSSVNARRQLRQCSGKVVDFYTGLCLIKDGAEEGAVECFRVAFRSLTAREISRYVELEQPLDCAGSFKCEGLGSVLFERLSGDDPTALEGLPLIRLAGMLREFGLDPLE